MEIEEINLALKRFILDKVLATPDFPLEYDTSLIKSGLLDSFAALEVAIYAEEAFRVELSDDHFGKVDCINDISGLVSGAKKGG